MSDDKELISDQWVLCIMRLTYLPKYRIISRWRAKSDVRMWMKAFHG